MYKIYRSTLLAALLGGASLHAQVTVTFREGLDGYTGTQDTYIRSAGATTSYGTAAEISVDGDDGSPGLQPNHGLIRFDNIIGSGAGQIPAGSVITAATLNFTVFNPGSGMKAHRMLATWSEASTWTTLTGGIQTDNTEASSTILSFLGADNSSANVSSGLRSLSITSAVQAWANGSTNFGIALIPYTNGTDGIDFRTSEYTTTVTERPYLTVTYTVPGTPPTVALTAPIEGSTYDAPATLNLAADASDPDAGGSIAKVEFFAGATKLGEDTTVPYEFAWTGAISGAYALTAKATDNVGATATSAAVNVTVTNLDNVSPTVALTAPAAGSTILTSTTTLAATATDTDGTIAKVEFYNGTTKLGEDTTSPFSFNWTALVNGNYALTAVATDNDGGITTSAVANVSVTTPITTTHIAKGSEWKYLDNGTDQGTAWKEVAYDDSTWAYGDAPLGYTDGHIVTTVFSPPTPNRYITTYFRRSFTVTGAATVQSLNLNILRDDGVVVYINGTEVARQNMPTGAINHLTFSSTIVDGTNETTYFPSTASPLPLLNEGINTIAVELHQRDGNSSDLGFDLEMISLSLPGASPTVAITAPTTGASLEAPATIAITADAADADGTIAKVEFFSGATKLGEDTDTPYEFTLSGIAQGSYSLTARATDNRGLTTTSDAVNVTVTAPNTIAPTVAITAPVEGAMAVAPATFLITADAADTDGTIAKVEFFSGTTKLGEDTSSPYEFAWSNIAAGSYVLTAKATDNLTANTTSTAVNITVNPNQVPTIGLGAPANSTSLGSSGVVNLSATVADPEGAPLAVTFYGRPKVAPPGADFTVVTLPDTQFYSENLSNRLQFFTNQTNWIVASKNLLNTQFVAHMGDMTQNYNTIVAEYENASQAMGIIENPATTMLTHGIPWGGAPGNHDIRSDGSTQMWNDYFGTARFATRTVANGGYFGGGYTDNTTDNNYQLFSASGLDFIVINLKYNSSTAGSTAVMNWADALLKAHLNRRAIVTSHWFIGTSVPPTQATWGGHGQAVYDNLKDNPNLFLMLCGHIHGEGRRADTFQGRTVNTVLQDYQSRSNGGDSWLRYFTFSPANNTITARTYKTNTAPAGSPLGGTFETDADSQFTLAYDMSGANSAWTALGTVNVPAGSTTASVSWTGLATNTEYEWYAAVSDSVNTPVGSTTRGFTTNGNAAPTVSLTSPANGASFNVPATVALAATAADIDGTIAKVEFFNGENEVGEDTEAPFTIDWTAPAGNHSITARATDGQGSATDSAAVAITVINPTPTVTLSAADDSAGEFGADQALVFTVSRRGSTAAPLNVLLTASGTASSADFSGFLATVVIPAGAASVDLPLTVLPDALAEGAEIVTLTLVPDAAYIIASPSTDDATIADRPDQAAYSTEIADPAKRGPADDGDGDGVANSIERFMGSLVGDPSSNGKVEVLEPTPGAFKVRYPRAKNRPELTGSLRWTSDLITWRNSGETDGTLTVTFAEAVVSAPGADPEMVEATASITGGNAAKTFVHLRVE